MNRAALFCDETSYYRMPEEPDPGDLVTLRFRTGREDADHVYLIFQDGTEKVELEKSWASARFDFYETKIPVEDQPVRFYFEITKKDESCCFSRLGVQENPRQEGLFCITPGFHVPEWAKGAVMYQIFVDRFRNGDPGNDVESDEYVYIGFPVTRVEDWEEGISVHDVDRFYGGDIQGIMEKLDYLKDLKVEVLYLNPVFVSPSNHKYDCQDYEHIDPHYGVILKDCDGLVDGDAGDNSGADKYMMRTTDPVNLEASDRLFASFVQAAHDRGMRVILDGVFNHCGSFNKWLDREKLYQKNGGYELGAYISKDSPYRNFFRFGNPEGWPDNDTYEGWWGHNTLPKLNYDDSEKLYQYILEIARKWLKPPFNIDGWRLDVAADLGHSAETNHKFWQDFRKAVKETKPDALILAEHYGEAGPWLRGNEWDTVMNYDAFMEPVSWFLTGMEKHSDYRNEHLHHNSQAFLCTMLEKMARLQTPSLLSAMNELSNHDHSRFLTRTNYRKGRLESEGAAAASEGTDLSVFMAAVVIQMTWPGAPTIYYGDEAEMYGWTDPDNRRPYPWGKENLELIELHKYLTGIRRRNPSFRTGSFKALLAENGMIAYGRFLEKERGVILVNSDSYEQTANIPVWEAEVSGGSMDRIMMTSDKRYNAGRISYPVDNGIMTVRIPPHSAMIFEEKVLDF